MTEEDIETIEDVNTDEFNESPMPNNTRSNFTSKYTTKRNSNRSLSERRNKPLPIPPKRNHKTERTPHPKNVYIATPNPVTHAIDENQKPLRRITRKRKVKRKKKKDVNGHPMPDYRAMSAEEKARWNADFNVKFGILREAYPEFNIPDFDPGTPLEIRHQHYDRYVRQIHIDNSVGNYRVYLMILFAGIELFCTKILGLDMSGYTINQLRLMNKYDRLLVELGEKSFISTGSDWPVEARIVVMALFNGIIFLVVRLFASYMGPGIGDMLQNMVNNFLNGDNNADQVKEGGTATAEGLVDPPARNSGGGFDLGSIINGLGGLGNLFGGGNNNESNKPKRRAPRRPAFNE